MSNTNQVKTYLLDLQERITQAVVERDQVGNLLKDPWEKQPHEPLQGYGESRVFDNGEVFEKAGFNFSHIKGTKLPPAATKKRPELIGAQYQAMGVSVVMHPLNPYVPTSHMNVRYFEAETEKDELVWWFGGGFDLTPYYGFEEDCVHWHQVAKNACDEFGADVYSDFKERCDNYFFLPHRNEPRGIGGIFYDDLHEWGFEKSFAHMQKVGDGYLEAYMPIVDKRKDMDYGKRERQFQLHRRGRYVEFNLVHDRGTHFGLQSKGRVKSILMSMPPLVRWEYDFIADSGSNEDKLLTEFLINRNWVQQL